MEEGGSSVPEDTGFPVTTAGAGSVQESVSAENAYTERMAPAAVADDDFLGNRQTAGSELVSDVLQDGGYADHLELADSNPEDNVGTSPPNNHADGGVLETGREEIGPGSAFELADVAGRVNVGSREDDISESRTLSSLQAVTDAELQVPSAAGDDVCFEGYFCDDDLRSYKEFASTTGGVRVSGIDSSSANADASQLEAQIQCLQDSEGCDRVNESGINTVHAEPAENLAGTAVDCVAPCDPEGVINDIAEDALGSGDDTFLADSVETQPEGFVPGANAIDTNQIDGSSSNPSEPAVKPVGSEVASIHYSGCALDEELVHLEKLDSLLPMHTGQNALQVTNRADILPVEDDESLQTVDKAESHNDSNPNLELSSSCHELPLWARTGENALQEASGACHELLPVVHEEESRNDSYGKVDMCNSLQESPATEPSCSHVEESSSSHLHHGADARKSCHLTENAISGRIVSNYCDSREDGGICGSNLHTFRDQSCFPAEESSATHLQHPSNIIDSCSTDNCLFPRDMAASTGSDDCGKSALASCKGDLECQPECCDLPENGGNNPTAKDPVSIRRNPRRAAHFKCMSNPVKPPDQAATATKVSRSAKAKNKKTPVSRSLICVSFENITRKRTIRNTIRGSGWGTIESLYKHFENRSFSDLPSEFTCIASASMMLKKCNRRKRSNTKKAGRGSGDKCVLDENSLAPNNQRNTQIAFSQFADSPYSENLVPNHSGLIKECPQIEQTLNAYACSQVKSSPSYTNPDNQATCSAGDVHIGDKDLESSVTLETSNENYHSDYPVVSSQTGPSSLAEFVGHGRQTYADTSPESEVIHPASDVDPTTNDIAMYINQNACRVSGIRSQNVCFPESHLQDNLDFATYAAPNASIPSPSFCSQSTSPMRGKENREILGHSSESIQEPLQENTICGFGWERNARFEQEKQTGASSSKCYKRKTKRKSHKEAQCQELQADFQLLKVVDNRCCDKIQEAEISGQYQTLAVDHNEKSTGATCTEGKTSKCRPKLKGSANKQHDSFRKNKKNSSSSSKKKRSKEKSLCQLAPGDGHHEVDAQAENICDNPSAASASFLDEAAESKRSMPMINLHNSQSATNADSLLDSGKILCDDSTRIRGEQALQSFGPLEDRQCWVRCDDCFKWRFIPTAIADTLGEDCKWTCKDNIDKNFADCMVPQAKTDSEINAELGISDEEEYNTAKPQFVLSSNTKATKPQAPWALIRSNLFLHRSRKKQNIDEVMVCQCRPPKDGSLGCGEACLNRMLNIECVRGTCPCGDRCSNQQFQRRKYAKLKWFRCGKKGYGLQVIQNVPRGKFLIEYVGEVLDMAAYEARQREYASTGQRHFYFMTLNGSEVIDACYKGNLGRFINHSCDPNCRTEKWMVNGEVCIGLFAIRDIKKGEEVTFDYNYVRVFGAAAKKCFCGSSDCRGYIGGDPLNSEHIVQGDSDEEFPEPVMVRDGEVRSVKEVKRQDVIKTESTGFGGHEKDVDDKCLEFVPVTSLQDGDECLQLSETVEKLSPVPPPEVTRGSSSDEETQSTVLAAATPLEGRHPVTDTIDNSLSLNKETDLPLQVPESICGSTLETYRPFVVETIKLPIATVNNEDLAKPVVAVKSCLPSGLAKSNKSEANRNSSNKGKKTVIGGHSCHFEGVDDKLNQLLDANGGISKHKDAARGYLKLLVLTAASRDNAESEAIQSTRDMSLILDSLLKTKSRTVLMDIINKNGLQMLHNILKQSRRNNNKVPILRKLLKVFEFFALKKILTVERINMIPSPEGVESFRNSILNLTRHADTQVNHIARNFLRWIPHSTIRKVNQLKRSDCQLDPKNTSSSCSLLPSKHHHGQLVEDADKIPLTSHSIICDRAVRSDIPSTNQETCKHDTLVSENLNGPRRRQRRTRWDHDEPVFIESTYPQSSEHHGDHDVAEHASRRGTHFGSKVSDLNNSSMHDVDDLPPGFDSPSLILRANKNPVHGVDMPDKHNVVAGIVQERYLPHLSISHGIPIQFMQQLGTLANEGSNSFSSWTVAPGMPFHPFPPLPAYPRKKSRSNHPPVLESAGVSESHHDVMASGSAEVSPSGRSTSSSPSELSHPSTSGRTHHQSRNFSASSSQSIKMGPSPMSNATRDSFRNQRYRDHRPNGFKRAWPRERNKHQFTGTKRCRTQNITDGDVLEKGGSGSGGGNSVGGG